MLFSTGTFWLFFPVVLALLWANRPTLRSVAVQNAILLGASYVFYGWWDWRFLGLIIVSTLIDYIAALGMERAGDSPARKRWLHLSVFANLSILGFFKYFNFFAGELKSGLAAAGVSADWTTLDIILPVGISFYTLQTLSYSIDVYYKRTQAPNITCCATPPMSRSSRSWSQARSSGRASSSRNLQPSPGQAWEPAYEGVRLIIAGLFLKVVIADNLAPYVDRIWSGTRNPGRRRIAAWACCISQSRSTPILQAIPRLPSGLRR